MNYELPTSIKRHSFWCATIKDFANFNKCYKLCRLSKNNRLDCWEKAVKNDLQLDCDVTNEKNAEIFAVCPECQSKSIVGCAFNKFMCSDCGAVFMLNKEQQRQCLGENFQELDEDALSMMFKKARDSVK